jgi:muramoyltetrapeptide carboxypeptidase
MPALSAHRVADLATGVLDDDEAKVILCSRGGYGRGAPEDKLDFGRFERHPKWLVGFSDITALHCYLQQQGFASIHGPMAKHLTLEPEDDPSTLKLKDLLFGKAFASRKLYSYTCNGHPL